MEQVKKEAKELFEAAHRAAIRNMPYNDNGTYSIIEQTKKFCASYIKEEENKLLIIHRQLQSKFTIPFGMGFWWDVKLELMNYFK